MAEHGEAGAPAQRALGDAARLQSLRQVCLSAESDQAFDRFAGLVKRLLGVPVALVSLVDDERQFFPGQVGLAEPWSEKRETPLSHSFCQHVVAEGVPKVFPDARIYAQVRDNLAIPDLGVVAYAGMPLKDADGLTLGSLCAIDTKPRAWTKDELAILEDLAEACASELRLRIARETAEEARRHAETAHDQLAMLAELTETFATTFDMEEGMQRLAEGVTPRLADWCLVTLVDQNGAVRHVASAHRDPAAAADVGRFADLMVTGLGARSAVLAVQRSGQPVRRDGETAEKILARTTNPEMADIADRLGYASFVIAPVTAPVTQRVLGSVTLVNGPGRAPFTEADERTALDIARRAGLAIDNSRLYGRQRHVAEVLQHSMLTELPAIPGMDLHARYLPAQDGAAVGGDWYDAFAQPDGSVMLAVGDVSGHDIEAAATMGQLRNLVRGDAYGRDDEPGPLLTQLDRAIRGLNVKAAATAVLARIRRGAAPATAGSNEDDEQADNPVEAGNDGGRQAAGQAKAGSNDDDQAASQASPGASQANPGAGPVSPGAGQASLGGDYEVTFANAGHPPPLVLLPDGTVEAWWETPEPLLGLTPRAQRATHRRTVPAGSTLLLYTDGLVEDPGHLLDEGIDRVAETLRSNAALPGEEVCSRLVVAAPRRADDIAFLLIRLL